MKIIKRHCNLKGNKFNELKEKGKNTWFKKSPYFVRLS